MTQPDAESPEDLLRTLAPQVLGALTRRYGDFAAAEDALQEALVAAAVQWPSDGMPRNPRGWLIRVASRRLIDQIRNENSRREREHRAAAQLPSGEWLTTDGHDDIGSAEDDTLLALFMCAHPTLTNSSAIALTLRAVGGLTTAEIAHAFMVPEATMAQRISRAKQRIKESGVPFRMPDDIERPQRLRAVLHVLYLIFNEGYTRSSGTHLRRDDLAAEAIRLTREVRVRLPDDAEAAGLLALMLLTHARRNARVDSDGNLISLDEQDRTLWDGRAINEGVALISAALPRGEPGPYQIQAAIAAVHSEAQSAEETDWPQVLALYGLLTSLTDNPMVALNRTIAVAMVHGPAAGLIELDALAADGRLDGHHRLDAVRAHFLEMAGEIAAAAVHYRKAAGHTASLPEQRYLQMRAARLAQPSD